jgi:hypothetical protein
MTGMTVLLRFLQLHCDVLKNLSREKAGFNRVDIRAAELAGTLQTSIFHEPIHIGPVQTFDNYVLNMEIAALRKNRRRPTDPAENQQAALVDGVKDKDHPD